MASLDNTKLNGAYGPSNFRELKEGWKIRMSDGSLCEITGNPGDGAYLLVKILEDEKNPDRVGEDTIVYFDAVKAVEA
jgi:hypothetical protein